MAVGLAITLSSSDSRSDVDLVDFFTMNELRAHSQYLTDSVDGDGVETTLAFRQAVAAGQQAIHVIDAARASTDWEKLNLAEAGLPDLCDERLDGAFGRTLLFLNSKCRRRQTFVVDRSQWLERERSHMSRRVTWVHEWMHIQQQTPVQKILKKHCWTGLHPDSPVPVGSGANSKAQLAYDMMKSAADAERAFREAEVRMELICNLWALCKMKPPTKNDPETGWRADVKGEVLKKLCDDMARYCCEFEEAVAAFDGAHGAFEQNHGECQNEDGDYEVENLQLRSRSGSSKNVGTVNLSALAAQVERYEGQKGQKAANGEPATGMAGDFEDKKNEIKCRLE